ncbi:MAG: cytochrome c3 family protein [Myxococcales bacterium]
MGHVFQARLDRQGNLDLESDGRQLVVLIPEHCPVHVPKHEDRPAIEVEARSLLSLGDEHRAQIGFDTVFELRAERPCREMISSTVTWTQLEGPALLDVRISEDGSTYRARTRPWSDLLGPTLPRGIVPTSPRTQGRYVLEARASTPDGRSVRRRITLTSIARATGLPSLSVGQEVLLGGAGWHFEHRPKGALLTFDAERGLTTFRADLPGKYQLADAAGRALEIHATTYERTPFDCARSECHARESSLARDTAMSHAYELAKHSRAYRGAVSGCGLDCHVVGEAGLRDGGFRDVARALSFRALDGPPFSDLPHALQRLGGVRCMSCHGPGAVPPPSGRARVLRTDVCATCHDAPPAYSHVVEWQSSAMARSDANAATRDDARCARCHTTGGFLHDIGVRTRSDLSRDVDGAVVGISCAACHAPHGSHLDQLVRLTELPHALSGTRPDVATSTSSICLPCHAPFDTETLPSASQAVLAQGRVRLPSSLGGAGDHREGPPCERRVSILPRQVAGQRACGSRLRDRNGPVFDLP